MVEIGTIERAFELARNGECESVTAILERLRREGRADVEIQLSDAKTREGLRELIRDSRL